MRAWLHHFVLNVGWAVRLACDLGAALYYGALPPQWTGHTPDQLRDLTRHDVRHWWRAGRS